MGGYRTQIERDSVRVERGVGADPVESPLTPFIDGQDVPEGGKLLDDPVQGDGCIRFKEGNFEVVEGSRLDVWIVEVGHEVG